MCDAVGDDLHRPPGELAALMSDSSKPPRARAEYAIEWLARHALAADYRNLERAQAVLLSVLVDFDEMEDDIRRENRSGIGA